MRETLLAILIAVSMTTIAPAAAAGDVAGASGQCFDDDGSGGSAHAAVTDDPGVETSGLTDVSQDDPTPSAVDAVLALTNQNGQPSEGDACTQADDDENGKDYVEVHAGGQQVCYDGNLSDDCPTRAD